MRRVLLIWLVANGIQVFAQDTIRLMHYNLLNYRNGTAQCDGSTNNATTKDGYLKTIVKFVKPDLFTCNELGSNLVNASRILDNALNQDGVDFYDQAQYSNNSFSDLTNMLFYDKRKFLLEGQDVIKQDIQNVDLVRVIDVYKLIYLPALKIKNTDTIRLRVIVAHLKAGSTTSDKAQRASMTEAVMAYLAKQTKRYNYVICGDFNVQTSSEQSFKNLVSNANSKLVFYDPVDALGNWYDNGNYANLHTQSTHSSSSNACFSSGGMDDRFDFILCSGEIIKHEQKISYVDQSYKGIGNDGSRLNGDINGANNSQYSQTLLDALYGMSDHIPVTAKFTVDMPSLGNKLLSSSEFQINNPVSGMLIVNNSNLSLQALTIKIIALNGTVVLTKSLSFNSNGGFQCDISELAPGLYTLNLQTESGKTAHFKLLKL